MTGEAICSCLSREGACSTHFLRVSARHAENQPQAMPRSTYVTNAPAHNAATALISYKKRGRHRRAKALRPIRASATETTSCAERIARSTSLHVLQACTANRRTPYSHGSDVMLQVLHWLDTSIWLPCLRRISASTLVQSMKLLSLRRKVQIYSWKWEFTPRH